MTNPDSEWNLTQLKNESAMYRGILERERKCWNVELPVDIMHSGRTLGKVLMADFLKTLNGVCSFFVICHADEHVDDDETKRLKYPHWHLVLKFQRKTRCQRVVLLICDFFEVEPVYLDMDTEDPCGTPKLCPWISIKATENDIGSIRYLTHIDNPEKKQYLVAEVMTNDKDYLKGCMLLNNGSLNGETLINLVVDVCYCSKLRVMRFLGLQNYCRYRMAIADICEEYGDTPLMKKNLKENKSA